MIARFDWMDAKTVDEAVSELNSGKKVMLKAGGVDVVDRLKEGLESPDRLVNIQNVAGLHAIESDSKGGMRIGTLVTLARLDTTPAVRSKYPALSDSAGAVATPNIRNMATIGGNLLQRPRCWYFRNNDVHCLKKGGGHCFAQEGENDYHAIFHNRTCAIVHPSGTATALVALGTSIDLVGPTGKRTVALEKFFTHEDIHRENSLAVGEMLTHINVPAPAQGTVTAYMKQGEMESHDWPVAEVAVALVMSGSTVKSASIILGAAAATPYRAKAAEAVLTGKTLNEENARAAAKASMQGAEPMTHNGFKIPLFEAIVRRTLMKTITA
jgi:xanthine dehydrogenase YagS FAD-binding subunit